LVQRVQAAGASLDVIKVWMDGWMDGGVFCNDEEIDWGRCLFRQSIRHTQCFVCECFLYSSCLSLCVCVYPSYAEMDASPMYIDVLG